MASTISSSGDRLKLYVDGKCVATSSTFKPADYSLANDKPLKIGFGQNDYFNGKLKDIRLYNRVLDEAAIDDLCRFP